MKQLSYLKKEILSSTFILINILLVDKFKKFLSMQHPKIFGFWKNHEFIYLCIFFGVRFFPKIKIGTLFYDTFISIFNEHHFKKNMKQFFCLTKIVSTPIWSLLNNIPAIKSKNIQFPNIVSLCCIFNASVSLVVKFLTRIKKDKQFSENCNYCSFYFYFKYMISYFLKRKNNYMFRTNNIIHDQRGLYTLGSYKSSIKISLLFVNQVDSFTSLNFIKKVNKNASESQTSDYKDSRMPFATLLFNNNMKTFSYLKESLSYTVFSLLNKFYAVESEIYLSLRHPEIYFIVKLLIGIKIDHQFYGTEFQFLYNSC